MMAGGGGVNDGNQYQRAAAVPIVQSLNSQAALYRLQHGDTPVGRVRFAMWEQFTQFSDERGNVSPVKGGAMRYGPYMVRAPVKFAEQAVDGGGGGRGAGARRDGAGGAGGGVRVLHGEGTVLRDGYERDAGDRRDAAGARGR